LGLFYSLLLLGLFYSLGTDVIMRLKMWTPLFTPLLLLGSSRVMLGKFDFLNRLALAVGVSVGFLQK
jgi:hypothetical protein